MALSKLMAQYKVHLARGTLPYGVCWFWKTNQSLNAVNTDVISVATALGLDGERAEIFYKAFGRYWKPFLSKEFGDAIKFVAYKKQTAIVFTTGDERDESVGAKPNLFATTEMADKFHFRLGKAPSEETTQTTPATVPTGTTPKRKDLSVSPARPAELATEKVQVDTEDPYSHQV